MVASNSAGSSWRRTSFWERQPCTRRFMEEFALPSTERGPVERGRGFSMRGSWDVGCSAGSESMCALLRLRVWNEGEQGERGIAGKLLIWGEMEDFRNLL